MEAQGRGTNRSPDVIDDNSTPAWPSRCFYRSSVGSTFVTLILALLKPTIGGKRSIRVPALVLTRFHDRWISDQSVEAKYYMTSILVT